MGELVVIQHRRATTHRQWITCVIEPRASRGQSLSCDLNQVLTLRGCGPSEHESLLLAGAHNK
jgi:hypothetical protein